MARGDTYPPEVLTRAEADSLLAACRRSPTGLRNRALIVLLYRGGLRLAEALAVRPHDIDWGTGDVRVLNGKGGRPRTTGIDQEAIAVLGEWAAARRGLSPPRDAPLICTLKGGPVKQAYVRALLPRLAERAGIGKRVHAHGLRHTAAYEWSAEGANVHEIRDLLGHRSLATTDTYLRALGASSAVEFARNRRWHADDEPGGEET